MDLVAINKKITDLNKKKTDLLNLIQNNDLWISTRKTDIKTIEQTTTTKGDEVKSLIKTMNKYKTEIASRKRAKNQQQIELNNIPYKIKYYERKRTQVKTPIMDYFQMKANEK